MASTLSMDGVRREQSTDILRGERRALTRTLANSLIFAKKQQQQLVTVANKMLPIFVEHELWRPRERAWMGNAMRSADNGDHGHDPARRHVHRSRRRPT